ncbi:MAG: Re/Si-specific NAD(P)(+) transhydrogenase subunit alpha [Prolixibacteraceae bacterium]|jgi:H+-translocating NAD(P) transhydrogenase subunit alpha|nr:Re/Si-specific NAD(P)(+) transhydrogenase subunit alpha [Prolixibacteraceae bacterium]MBT6006500.1 Re/Si-specific NAD(P)(+) transhydrogenase subunit alpha [Prolixibacteraceae bacterium]MBT6764936.1 Re/Si-specific NAD(P)(+) transhydrogenase subunit alpha [Prolixibacteraceae bacterium]MBT6997410.1 Re/Si-specific NAD(P)(+) transhydrogenase subunit alpha [Prolixibacteraceae bacterium]MBT7396621.1 Re/Si-specific NAD(P)(+) transhydrogenase subunit alpha [Prolixibacteraceae bacterium]
MILGLLKEYGTETRVALLPETVKTFTDLKVEVLVEKGAGENAFTSNADYEAVGAKVVSRADVFGQAEVLLQIQPPAEEDIQKIKETQVWISAFNPLWDTKLVKTFLEKGVTTFSLDLIPRTSRAQAMDILSSMATVSGYMAVLEAAVKLPTFFPMFMTAAGTIRPANILILGAGVAGLQAIATSRKLGAQVQVFDVRSAVKEEVMSLGGKFVEVEGATEDKAAGGYAVEQTEDFKKKQQQAINDHAAKANVVICTAQIPGRKAPLLIPTKAVEAMKPGSVIIDLAASSGGNCEVTKDNETIVHKGVTVIGQSNYPAQKPLDASKMFGKNVFNFMKLIIGEEGALNLNFEDDIVKGTCITHAKEIYNERVKSVIENA